MSKAVQNVFTFAAFGGALRSALSLSADMCPDSELRRLLTLATVTADAYLNNPFDGSRVDENGDKFYPNGLTLTEPREIRDGLIEFVRIAQELNSRPFGATSVRTDALAEAYAIGTRIRGGEWSPADILRQMGHYWFPHRMALDL